MDTSALIRKKPSFMNSLVEELKARGQRLLPRSSDVLTGRVLTSSAQRLFVDLGPLGIGIIEGSELAFLADRGIKPSPGESITVNIIDWEDDDGLCKLSVRSAGEEKRWSELAEFATRGETLPVEVRSATRGGLVVSVGELEAFLPASQLSDEHYPRVEGGKPEEILRELSRLVGSTLLAKILSWDRSRAKIIVSERAVADEEIRAKLERFSGGDVIRGTVKGIVDFGVFVGFDEGLEGLIHISELSWRLVDDPRQVVDIGQEVEAKIIGIEGPRVSLSLRSLTPNPWEKVGERYQVGQQVCGSVVKLHPYGAFVRLDPDIHGLIHISEFGGSQEEMQSKLELGKSYEFEIMTLEPEARRLGLRLSQQHPPMNADENADAR